MMTNDEEGNHDHVPCCNVFRPTRKVPEVIAKKLRYLQERMKTRPVKTIDTPFPPDDTKSLGGK